MSNAGLVLLIMVVPRGKRKPFMIAAAPEAIVGTTAASYGCV